MERIGIQISYVVPDPADIRERAPILAPFIIVVLMHVVGALSLRGPAAHALSADQATAVAVDWMLAILMVSSPVIVLVKALVVAALTWAVLVLLSEGARFKILASIHVYGGMLLALPAIATVVVLRLRGPGAVQGPEDLLVPMGLDVIIDVGSSPTTLALMQQTTIFHVLWVVFVSWLLCRAGGVSGRNSIVTGLALWGFGIGYAVVRAAVFSP